MKSLVIATMLFVGASVANIIFDVWEIVTRDHSCMAVQRVDGDRDAGLVYKGNVPCPIDGQ